MEPTNNNQPIKPNDLNDENSFKFRENYFDTFTSPTEISMILPIKKGISSVNVTTEDFQKGEVICKSSKYESDIFNMHFKVPFTMVKSCESCPVCKEPIEYVNGVKQYLARYAHFDNPEGWMETKNQYSCKKCSQYIVNIERTYILVHAAYYVLHVYPTTPCSEYKVVTNYGKQLPCYKWPQHGDPISWDGKCFICGSETILTNVDCCGCVTGKSSCYNDSVCPKCSMIHYAEEHND